MTLEESTGILKARLQDVLADRSDRTASAVQLGIEALELNLFMRQTYPYPDLLILPSETKD